MSKNGTNQTAQLLHRAADIIETDGWQQGDFGSPADGWCAIGAIQQAAVTSINLGDANDAIDDAIYALKDAKRVFSDAAIVAWNDHPDRTAAEVTRTLRTTADQLTKDHQ